MDTSDLLRTHLTRPHGVYVSADGALYVSDSYTGLIQVFDKGIDELGHPYFVMEMVSGTSLFDSSESPVNAPT